MNVSEDFKKNWISSSWIFLPSVCVRQTEFFYPSPSPTQPPPRPFLLTWSLHKLTPLAPLSSFELKCSWSGRWRLIRVIYARAYKNEQSSDERSMTGFVFFLFFYYYRQGQGHLRKSWNVDVSGRDVFVYDVLVLTSVCGTYLSKMFML